ncbi:Putative lumazine-binding [Spirosomataceae bacterium TFI 002]|nr:Putative lumazine-binding [Spirosomataceae bacterium TFI 002]
MKNHCILIFSVLSLFLTLNSWAQDNENTKVQASIEGFFEGMKSGDTSLIKQQLYNYCDLKTIGINKNGAADIHETKMEAFINIIANKPASQILDERISSYDIKIDQNMAVAWTPYKFYVNDNFSHCGVNVFSLIKDGDKWKIFAIMDTRQKTGCD